MFNKVSVPVLGMVQNMSSFICPECSHVTSIFGKEGVERECAKHNLDLLADIPLNAQICNDADRGCPTVVADQTSEEAKVFMKFAKLVAEKCPV